MVSLPYSPELWIELEAEEPDLGVTPVPPARTGERIWRFEGAQPRLSEHGTCPSCGNQHVPDRPSLDRILRQAQRGRSDLQPCLCDCCRMLRV